MSQSPQLARNGPVNPEDDDTFERDLKEMLKDGPSLNDLSSTVQGGNVGEVNRQTGTGTNSSVPMAAPPGSASGTSLPRSHSVPPATSNIPLSSPERNGAGDKNLKLGATLQPQNSKLDAIRSWSINTYKCTKQIISEKFGRGSRTVDLELEAQIEALRDTQRKYANILRLARALTSHFYHVVQTQRALGEAFSDLSQKSPELQEEFTYNAETQKALGKNGETLLGALNFFTSSVNTLCNKTMEDTLMTIKLYEAARVEYDAYRTDLETLQLGPKDNTTAPRLEEAQRKFSQHKEKFDKLRGDVAIKLKFLDENKVVVSQKQLFLLHKAFSSYVAGNQTDMETIVKDFHIDEKTPADAK